MQSRLELWDEEKGVRKVEVLASEPGVFYVTHGYWWHGRVHGDADVRFLRLAIKVSAAQLPQLPHSDLVADFGAPGREMRVGIGHSDDFSCDLILAGAKVTDILNFAQVVVVQPKYENLRQGCLADEGFRSLREAWRK